MSNEARHHLLQPFFGVGMGMDERHGGVRDDPFLPSLAHDGRTDDFGIEGDLFPLPLPGKAELQPFHRAPAMLDERAANSYVKDECAMPIQRSQNGFRKLQPLELSTLL